MSLDNQSGADDRAKFEADYASRYEDASGMTFKRYPDDASPDSAGHYRITRVQYAWEGWQARAALQAQPSAPANPNAMHELRKLFVELTNTQEVSESGAVVGHIIFNEQLDRLEKLATPADMPAIDEATESRYSQGNDLVRRLMKAAAEDGEAGYSFNDNLFSGETKNLEYELCKLLEQDAAAPKECATTVAMIDEALAEGSDYHDLRARLITLLAQQPVAAISSDDEFNMKRLRRLAVFLGLGSAIPESDTDLRDCMGSLLGMISRKVEEPSASTTVMQDEVKS